MSDRNKGRNGKPSPAKQRPFTERKIAASAPVVPERQPEVVEEAPVALHTETAVLPTVPTPKEIAAPIVEAIAAAPAPEDVIEAVQAETETTFAEGSKTMENITSATNNTFEAGQQAANQAFGEINDRAKGMMEKNAKIVQEMSDLTKGNVEAFVASSRVAAKAFETIGRDAAEYGRRSFEEASTAFKSFAEVRSPADLFRLQSEFVRAQFDQMVAEGSKMSETVIKLAGEVAEPITNRYSVAAERVKSMAA